MKLPTKDRIFWKNFFTAFGLFFVFPILALVSGYIDPNYLNTTPMGGFSTALFCVGFFAILNVCYRAGMYFARSFEQSEQLEAFRRKEGLTEQEFRAKYKNILDIIHN